MITYLSEILTQTSGTMGNLGLFHLFSFYSDEYLLKRVGAKAFHENSGTVD